MFLALKSSLKDGTFSLRAGRVNILYFNFYLKVACGIRIVLCLGFMGKVLIEKLLRSCPDLNRIFMLLREKKNKAPEQRLEEMSKIPVFDRLHQEYPNHFSKVCPINGDCSMIGLGISDEDLKRMENVSVVFHSAASVRFDDALKDAILLNTRGTVEVLKFAEKLKSIRVVLHVSTTYCNPDKKVVEEMIYPPKCGWRDAIKVAENVDEYTLNALTQKYTNCEPNTYTFTKGLSEQAVKDYSDRLPVVIFRPSIVVSSLDEPMPGWIDNFNGLYKNTLIDSNEILKNFA